MRTIKRADYLKNIVSFKRCKKIQEQKREDMVKNNNSLSKLPSDKHDI